MIFQTAINQPLIKLVLSGASLDTEVTDNLIELTYTDYLEGMSDELTVSFEDTTEKWINGWWPINSGGQQDLFSLTLGYKNNQVNVGDFELDEIEFQHPPSVVTLRALSTGLSKQNRTLKAKAYDNTTLSAIVNTIAKKMKLKVVGEIKDISITRITQYQESNVAFLTRLAREYGYSFKVVKDKLVFTAIADLHADQEPVILAPKDIISISLRDRISATAKSVKVVGFNSNKKSKIERKKPVQSLRDKGQDSSGGGKTSDDELTIITRADNQSQIDAKQKAAEADSQQAQSASIITLWGNPKLVAGSVIKLGGYGQFSGEYLVNQSRHLINKSQGYTTEIQLKMLEQIDDAEDGKQPEVSNA